MMEHLLASVVASVGIGAVMVVLVVLCLFWRKKPASTLPKAATSSELSDVTIEDDRNMFDDPYHSIDYSDDVKTLSSANSGNSGDSAFDTSPSGSGHSLQVSKGADNSPSTSPQTKGGGGEGVEEAVYEVIAFEPDGSVNHNPDPSLLHQTPDVTEQSYQTYEEVGEGTGEVWDSNPSPQTDGDQGDVAAEGGEVVGDSPSNDQRDVTDVDLMVGDDEVFGEPLYSPVYEGLYVDCVSSSQDRKDSGVVQDMVPSPQDSTPARGTPLVPLSPSAAGLMMLSAPTESGNGPATSSKVQNAALTPSEVSSSQSQAVAAQKPPRKNSKSARKDSSKKGSQSGKGGESKPLSHWGSIKARISQMRKGKKRDKSQGDGDDQKDCEAHVNGAFEGEDPSPQSTAPDCGGQLGDNTGGQCYQNESPYENENSDNDCGQAESLPASGEVSDHTGDQPFSYLAQTQVSQLPKALPTGTVGGDTGLSKDGGADVATDWNSPMSACSGAGQPAVLPGRQLSLQNLDGLSSGLDTPRSGSKPKPPVPPKPVRAQ